MGFMDKLFMKDVEADIKKSDETGLFSHLKEGFKPIMVGVGTLEQFFTTQENGGVHEFKENWEQVDSSKTHDVDWSENRTSLERKGFKVGGGKGDHFNDYVISPVDSLDKFSKGFYNCTGVLITSQDKATGENISFLSHQNSVNFTMRALGGAFNKDLQRRLKELKDKSIDGSIDAVIVGGNYHDYIHQEHYLASIKGLDDIVSGVLGFEPRVVTGPKIASIGVDNVFYDNKNRRLYISRPEVGLSSTDGFAPKDIEEKKKTW